ncbi:MAG: ABC transporter permease, partial [Anaerolineae bacterium]|nr:ABC transporter permease [Anaerolineae bacterium]
MALLGVAQGEFLEIELAGDRTRSLRVAGVAHDMVQVPAQFDGSPYGYVTMETLFWFGLDHGYNELHVIAMPTADGVDEKAHVQEVINWVKDRAERNGMTIPSTLSVEPGMLPLGDILQAVLLLMGTLGLLSLLLSVFLIINTVSALLTQQKRQIGVMKAVGARSGQLMRMYLVMMVAYGLSALLIAAPLSAVGSRQLSRFMAGLFNFDLTDLSVSRSTYFVLIVVGVLVPVAASVVPFLANLRIPAAEAMRDFQLGKGKFGHGLIARLLAGRRLWFARAVVRRPLLLSVRNTFRSRGRLLLTLTTLTLASAIFVAVFSVRASLTATLDDVLRWWGFDVMLGFTQPYRAERVIATAMEVPQVAQSDIWLQLPARRLRDDGSEGGSVFLFAPRIDSELVLPPTIVDGRWLMPEDENALVVNAIFVRDEADVGVGDTIVLKVMGREQPYRVVGVCLGVLAPMIYAPYDTVARTTGNLGQAGAALVRLEADTVDDPEDPAAYKEITTALEEAFERRGLHVGEVQTVAAERIEGQTTFDIVVVLLLVMAVLLALVGGLGLTGTMSINVLERRREIGVLRAIGAPTPGVAKVFVREGVVIGLMSWAFGSVLAYPLGRLLAEAVGRPLLGAPLTFAFSSFGVILWLGCVVILSVIASALPARKAARLTVREVLAYE